MEKKDNTPSDSSSSTDQTPTNHKTLYERRTKKKQGFDLSSPDFSSSDVTFDFDSGVSTAGESVPSLETDPSTHTTPSLKEQTSSEVSNRDSESSESERSLSSNSPKHSLEVEFKKLRLGKQDTLDEVENLPSDTPPEEPATQTVSETAQIDEPTDESTLPLPSSARRSQHLNVKSCLEEPPAIIISSSDPSEPTVGPHVRAYVTDTTGTPMSEMLEMDESQPPSAPTDVPQRENRPQTLEVKSCLGEPPVNVSSSGKKRIKIPEKFAMELAKEVFYKVFGKTDQFQAPVHQPSVGEPAASDSRSSVTTKPAPDRETPTDVTIDSENAPGSSSSSDASPTTIMETSTPATPANVSLVESPSSLTPQTRPELPSESPMDISEAKDPTDENQANVSAPETGDRNLEKAERSTSELPSAPSTEGPSDADECVRKTNNLAHSLMDKKHV